MASGDFGFALNEVNLGLALSTGIRRMLAAVPRIARAREILLFGEPVTAERALEIGLVREIAPAEEVRARAVACAKIAAAKPPIAFGEIKRSLREVGGAGETSSEGSTLNRFLDMWFSDEARECRKRIAVRI